jgi:hypothetical protein
MDAGGPAPNDNGVEEQDAVPTQEPQEPAEEEEEEAPAAAQEQPAAGVLALV